MIRNPLGEDTSLMRTIALPGMLDVLAHNYNNRNERACLYELGNIYLPPRERRGAARRALHFDVRLIRRRLRLLYGEWASWKGSSRGSIWHPGKPRRARTGRITIRAAGARITCGEDVLGYLYEVHPKASENFGLGHEAVYGFELDMALLQAHAQARARIPDAAALPVPSRATWRFCAKKTCRWRYLKRPSARGAGKLLERIELFDVYQGEQILSGMKSVAFRLILRSKTATLTEEEIHAAMDRAMQELEAAGASLRA